MILEEINSQLDKTRIALNINFNAYDDDLKETYDNFVEESQKLLALLNKIIG